MEKMDDIKNIEELRNKLNSMKDNIKLFSELLETMDSKYPLEEARKKDYKLAVEFYLSKRLFSAIKVYYLVLCEFISEDELRELPAYNKEEYYSIISTDEKNITSKSYDANTNIKIPLNFFISGVLSESLGIFDYEENTVEYRYENRALNAFLV